MCMENGIVRLHGKTNVSTVIVYFQTERRAFLDNKINFSTFRVYNSIALLGTGLHSTSWGSSVLLLFELRQSGT